MGLDALCDRVRRDLACLNYGAASWVTPRTSAEGHVYDVVIVGGGQSGLGAAFGLMRERISNLLVIDENPEGREGPWDTYARMVTLRTPKWLTSIDLGVPSLTFRAWWEALHGEAGWEALDKIPRGAWMDYLRWYRKVLKLPVVNETKLTLIEPAEGGLYRLHLDGPGAPAANLLTRKVVLATGIQGGGQWHVPPMIEQRLPRGLYAHTSEAVDFAALKGKRLAILGGGASAFDNANHALSEGAAEAHVFVRRDKLPSVNPIRQMEGSGMIERFHTLTDAEKYRVISHFFQTNQPPTADMFERAAAWPGFVLHLGAPWLDVEASERGITVTTPHGREVFDFLIVSTGLISDPGLRPELRMVERHIKRWGEVYAPRPGRGIPCLTCIPI
ncbi:FAD-dependent urate hydroxylase [Paenibacillus sp. HMSSN-139]|nr:FAD-dependent urate hydroxylase [Paenibacillus sp. HMSSN-139]